MIKILIDTDLGSDVDDSIALYLALRNKDVRVVGITTVFKNAPQRARIARSICTSFGKNVPVFAGSRNATDKQLDKNADTLFSSLVQDVKGEDNPQDENGDRAIDFILDCAKKYGKELHILAIGPLTNIARAVCKDRKALEGIGSVTLMGGNYFQGKPEWNFYCDATAAQIVLSSGLKVYAVGSDVTVRTVLPYKLQEQTVDLASLDTAKGLIGKHAKLWMDKSRFAITLHDPLALYAIVYPELLHFKEQLVAVEAQSKTSYGYVMNYSLTAWYPKTQGHSVMIADYVDEEKVIGLFVKEFLEAEDC